MSTESLSGPILAAVRFDRNVAVVMRAALSIAKARDLPVRLTYVFSPMTPSATAEFATLRARLQEKSVAYARIGIDVDVDVLIGDYPDTLLEHAEELGAALIIIGAHQGPVGLLRSKLRPVLQLLEQSSVPVLVMPEMATAGHVDNRSSLKVLLADDLSDGSLPVLGTAARLVSALGIPLQVTHLHVEALPAVGLALSPEFQLDVWPGFRMRERGLNEYHAHLKAQMHQRAEQLATNIAETGGSYHAELWHGSVPDELARAATALGTDLSIFGRHHFLHRESLAFGQMPFPAMLRLTGALLVAPP